MFRSKRKKSTAAKPLKLSREAQRIIAYWRDSIIEGERATVSPQAIRQLSTRISQADFIRGHCSPENFRTLSLKLAELDAQRKSLQKSKLTNEQTDEASNPIPVLICPIRFSRSNNIDSGPSFLEVLWIPALLMKDGTFTISGESPPSITRELLEPTFKNDYPVIGELSDLEKFSVKNSHISCTSWREYLAYANKMLQAVTGANWDRLTIPGYTRKEGVLLFAGHNSQSSYSHIAELLQNILAKEISAGTLAKCASLSNPKSSAYRTDKWELMTSTLNHLGHFNNTFALAPSQRQAIHRFIQTPKSNFLCISGPPGTGKTTVIQNILASYWVKHALAQSLPAVIVCTGATNQSVINIIDCFNRGDSNEGSLISNRWLPKIHSFGTFCSSATKAASVQHLQLELRDGSGLSAELETPEYLSTASKHFLDCAGQFIGKRVSIKQAANTLHSLLKVEHRKFRRELNELSQLSIYYWISSLFSKQQSCSYEQILAALPAFDLKYRNSMFNLATHYWEARWLLACSELLSGKNRDSRNKSRFDGRRDTWQRRAMITPAFVSTLSMLSRFFPYNLRNPNPPIDILVCDESGQIPVELGVAALALCERAAIIGDCLQLEPYWNVQPHTDRIIAQKHKLFKTGDESTWTNLSNRGMLASNASLMKLALCSTEKLSGNTRGVFLSEQRRSVPELVSYSNMLAYRDRLQAMRPKLEKRVFPAFGFVHIEGKSDTQGTSRFNQKEARAIIDWLSENETQLKRYYKKTDLAEIIAIITPFAAQHRKLREILPEKYSKLIIGTVNGLQGAERPVVIFSSVYDEQYQGEYFFDQSVNMLNVAVSRAKDSFIVFGNMRIFNLEAPSPSGILARFLFAEPGNRLQVAAQGKTSAAQATAATEHPESSRLSTLHEHVNILRNAFTRSNKEVILVSPTVSSIAIIADRLPELIRQAVERNIKVKIYIDHDLNIENGIMKKVAADGIELLKQTGAEVIIASRIHNKSLAIDDSVLVEGSFNWLSANRNSTSKHQKHETSWVLTGTRATKEIARLKDEMAYREKAVSDLNLQSKASR